VANSVQVQRVSHTHNAILDFMVANPTAPLSHVATYFGYTQSWLSTVIHSDAFQARLRERQDTAFNEVVVADLRAKITGVASQAIDKLSEKLAVAADIRDVKDSAEMLLRSIGWGQPKAAAAPARQTNIVVLADRESLARSRELMQAASEIADATERLAIEHSADSAVTAS